MTDTEHTLFNMMKTSRKHGIYNYTCAGTPEIENGKFSYKTLTMTYMATQVATKLINTHCPALLPSPPPPTPV